MLLRHPPDKERSMQKAISLLLIAFGAAWAASSSSDTTTATLPKVVKKIAFTNRTTTIPATTLLKPTTSGLYRISVYMVQPFPTSSSCENTCGVLTANFRWTDDGGKQVMSSPGPGVAFNTPIAIDLDAAAGQGNPSCAQNNSGTCIPAWENLNGVQLPGATFVVRVNAGTPLIYSVTGEVGSGVAYDFFLTVEQL